MLVNQVIITTVWYTKHHILMVMKKLLVLVLLLSSYHLLLSPELKHLTVRIWVFSEHKCWASCRPVLRHKPARLVPYTTRIAQRLWPHGSSPPLRRLIRGTMQALATIATFNTTISFLLPRLNLNCLFPRIRMWGRPSNNFSIGGWSRGREHKKAWGPIARRCPRPFAPSLSGDSRFRIEHCVVNVTNIGDIAIVIVISVSMSSEVSTLGWFVWPSFHAGY